jgi:hypothetical protein
MMPGFWKLKVTADIGIGPYDMLSLPNQKAQFGHISHLDHHQQ